MSSAQEIKLYPNQVDHFNRVYNIISNQKGYIDLSPTGSGKTIIVAKLCQSISDGQGGNMMPLVVCKASLVGMWVQTFTKYGIKYLDVISYEKFRGRKGDAPSNPWLTRTDEIHQGPKGRVTTKTYFTPKQPLIALRDGDKPFLVVIDESQSVKNAGAAQTKAVNALLKAVDESQYGRFALISASPLDKEKQVINTLKLIGILRSQKLYVKPRGEEIKLTGLQEIIDVCRRLSLSKTQQVLSEYKQLDSKEVIYSVAFRLFNEVIKPTMASKMPPIVAYIKNVGSAGSAAAGEFENKVRLINDVKNGYYNLTKEDEKELTEAVESLEKQVAFIRTRNALGQAVGVPNYTPQLRAIEKAKIPLFIRLGTEVLTDSKNPGAKVIYMMSFTENIDIVANTLNKMFPGQVLIYDGRLKKVSDKDAVIAAFNTMPQYRVLVAQIRAGSVGISLHDTVGDAPRTMFISPTFSVQDLFQASGRVYRQGVASQPRVRIVYGKGEGVRETKILNGLAQKSTVIRNVVGTDQDAAAQAKLPAEYETYIEP
jgi:hypothetical protein